MEALYKKLLFIFFALLPFLAFCQQDSKPNIIFIFADDLAYDNLSVNGCTSYSTPNLDSMAHYGINFTHCESTPLCSPSRCMVLTGKQNLRNYSNWGYLDTTEKTFGNVMQDAGYKTGFFGKLQMPFSVSNMRDWGFDKYTVFNLTEDTIEMQRYKSPTLVDENGRVDENIVENKYCDDILTDRIFDFIDSTATSGSPFFIYYPMSLVHAPFAPTPADSAAYLAWDPSSDKLDTSNFRSMVEYMDFEVGKILSGLAQRGIDENTIVVFAGDNGTPEQIYYNTTIANDLRGEKSSTHERGTHVPLIAYWPGHIPSGEVNDDLIDLADFLPTFAEAGNITNLSKYGTLDGLSFYKRMFGIEDTAKSQLFLHFDSGPGFTKLKRWVRDKTYKLYDSIGSGGIYRFYNIVNDEEEQHPLTNNMLNANELEIRAKFIAILDSMPSWAASPKLKNPFIKNITANSVEIGATIKNSGTSELIDRGSNIKPATQKDLDQETNHCPLGADRLRDSSHVPGKFSQVRTNLKSQTNYLFSMYAMNANESHSTGYAKGKFITLSAPPLTQPGYFTDISDKDSILLNWNSSAFPSTGASRRGYAIFYSTDSIQLKDNINGVNPNNITTNGTLVRMPARKAPKLPDTTVVVKGLNKNIAYHFILIPYTCNGKTDSTYNYLTQNALTLTTDTKIAVSIEILPNPATSYFNLVIDKPQVQKIEYILVYDVNGKIVYENKRPHNSEYEFGQSFPKGEYFVMIKLSDQTYKTKVIKY
jgi:arylsulfatase A